MCCLYETEEGHRAVLAPFLRQGLDRGEKVLCIGDTHTADAVFAYLRHDGVDVEPYLARGQLVFVAANDAYVAESVFDPDRTIAMLRTETEEALAAGYTALRCTGDMIWALRGLPGSERLIEYEGKLNEFFAGRQCLAICQYDRRRFEAALLLDVLRTHPFAMFGAEVYDNPYYIPPAAMVGGDLAAAMLDDCVKRTEELRQSVRVSEEQTNLAHDLGERVKELDCIYRISYLAQLRGIPLNEILQRAVEAIPAGWQYPENTCARIIAGGREFKTETFEETGWRQMRGIRGDGGVIGTVEVHYLEQRPGSYEGPFLKEERSLINTIAGMLGNIVELHEADENLRKVGQTIESMAARQIRRRNPYGLTFRELMVLRMVAAGSRDTQIAGTLGISPRTAETHVKRILNKMDSNSRAEAVGRAVREGLID
jgi:DNA-binding CsgD family transcriptional regulator